MVKTKVSIDVRVDRRRVEDGDEDELLLFYSFLIDTDCCLVSVIRDCIYYSLYVVMNDS